MKKLILILFCNLFFSLDAQTIYDLKESFIIRLTKTINPNKDSIQRLKLKEIRTIYFQNKKTDTTISSSFDKNGNVLNHKDYTFRYNSKNQLTFIKYYWSSTDQGQGFDSLDFTKSIDTNAVYRVLGKFNKVLYDKSMFEVYKLRKANFNNDTINFENGQIEIYNQKNPDGIVRYISRINFRSYPHLPTNNNIIETVKYNYGDHPPSMEIIREDTLNKISQSLNYYYPSSDEKNSAYIYSLTLIFTTMIYKDHSEILMENFSKNDRVYKTPQYIDVDKFYNNYEEHYRYKKTHFKRKKLIVYYKLTTDKTYYK